MIQYIHEFALSTKNHRVRLNPSDVFKLGTYVSFFVVSSIVFSGSTYAKAVCSTQVIEEEGSPTLSPGLIDAMYEAISTNTFDLDEPYTVISKKHFCTGLGKSNIGSESAFDTFNNVPNPDPTPKEDDKQTVTQTRADGTRTWSYTYINGVWVLTGYKYTPTPDADSLPDEP
ncbi:MULTISPECIES: hypothetical protein [Pseudidiomarina]|uniref:Uncharacterized protein n=2 Tax=Pseudidiomarina TaxID=2800384 RepID=A0A368UUF0_9GAMM|nr:MULTISPECIES: hypothetical protein [Pseudidiomarina]PWW07949.1 hypothetical protein DET45_12321 [Pseudidiomarina maritima]RBP90216.1 hypothetical protein DFO81_10880 [Pseudidiomarina tainanensis]RCW31670.1 hypothetical protein DFO79_10818 [Pseudidiomarina tainanensis]